MSQKLQNTLSTRSTRSPRSKLSRLIPALRSPRSPRSPQHSKSQREQPREQPRSPHRRPHHSHIAVLSKIHPKLRLTSVDGAVKQHGPIAIIAVATPETTDYLEHHEGAAYRAFVRADDTEEMEEKEFVDVFTKASDLLNQQLHDPKIKTVFVHCYAGINRSVCTIMAYVVRYTNLDQDKTLQYITQVNSKMRNMDTLTNRRFRSLLGKLPRAS